MNRKRCENFLWVDIMLNILMLLDPLRIYVF